MTLELKSYRRAAVPILAVQTADPAEVTRVAVREVYNNGESNPALLWDCIHGVVAINNAGQSIAQVLNGDLEPAIATSNPMEALSALEKLRDNEAASKAVVVMHGMGDVLSDSQAGVPARQALWNLRDVLPTQGILLVLTVPMGWRNPFPDDIAMTISELPEPTEHKAIATRLCSDAGIPEPEPDVLNRIGDALLGLSSFASEQTIALSLTKNGVDVESLWDRKRQQISETDGLSIYAGSEKFDDLGGLSQAKRLFKSLLSGKRKPGAIVFIDEIEKSLSGSSGDTSGVSQSMLGYLLSYMQDNNATGSIFVGPPGAAKSAFAKAMGNEADIPTVTLDLGGLKGSLVGESEKRTRTALSVVSAISGDRPFFVATCNAISVLPPELRRRFTVGTMFFDLPNSDERETIWDIYVAKYNLDKQTIPDSAGWTGAEIKQCADMSDRLGVSLIDAAQFVVPVSTSAREQISTLRQDASGRYLSASSGGVYTYSIEPARTSRNITLD